MSKESSKEHEVRETATSRHLTGQEARRRAVRDILSIDLPIHWGDWDDMEQEISGLSAKDPNGLYPGGVGQP